MMIPALNARCCKERVSLLIFLLVAVRKERRRRRRRKRFKSAVAGERPFM